LARFLRTAALLLAVLGARPGQAEEGVEAVIARMRAAYSAAEDYQIRVESASWEDGRGKETRLLYRFKKPNRIRIDFLKPRAGWVLVYPTTSGKVRIRPAGILRFLPLTLDPGRSLLTVWPGQQVTQTGLGLLVENIARSVTTGRIGPVELSRDAEDRIIRVEAQNHFLEGVPTRYEFRIDGRTWLPSEVREEVPGKRKREIHFRDLRVNLGLPDGLFRLD
jgi:outer membrane lipoprotein-sorting protein